MVKDRFNMVELCVCVWGWGNRVERVGEKFLRESFRKDWVFF